MLKIFLDQIVSVTAHLGQKNKKFLKVRNEGRGTKASDDKFHDLKITTEEIILQYVARKVK